MTLKGKSVQIQTKANITMKKLRAVQQQFGSISFQRQKLFFVCLQNVLWRENFGKVSWFD